MSEHITFTGNCGACGGNNATITTGRREVDTHPDVSTFRTTREITTVPEIACPCDDTGVAA